MIATISLIFFIFRLSSHHFDGYLKYHDFDREIAEKFEIYSLCIESKKYTWFHKIGITLSSLAILCSFLDLTTIYGIIISSLFWMCGFVFILFYVFKFEKRIKAAAANEFRCVRLLNSFIYSTTKGQYSNNPKFMYWNNVEAKEADAIENLYLCCQFDRNMLIWDLATLGLFALSLISTAPI